MVILAVSALLVMALVAWALARSEAQQETPSSSANVVAYSYTEGMFRGYGVTHEK